MGCTPATAHSGPCRQTASADSDERLFRFVFSAQSVQVTTQRLV